MFPIVTYQISPGEGATHIESIVMRDNRRFDAIAEQVQRKAERLLLSKTVIYLHLIVYRLIK